MKRFRFAYKETITTILAENEDYYEVAVKAILEARSEIEKYAILNPYFLISYEPIECNAKGIVKKMCDSAKIAGVGPMASVAGAIAQFAVDKMIEAGAKIAVVDNGGDIAIFTDRELRVGIFPTNIALLIPAGEKIALCTSSGKIGPSVSFGYADAATVIADDACLADALATALGNAVGDFKKEKLEKVVGEFYSKYRSFLRGIIVVKDDLVVFSGNIPKIVTARIDENLITKG